VHNCPDRKLDLHQVMVVAREGRWISYAFHRRRVGMVREMDQRCPKRVSNPCRRRFFRSCHQPSTAAEPSVTGHRSLPANRGEGIASPLELRDQAPSTCVHANSTAPDIPTIYGGHLGHQAAPRPSPHSGKQHQDWHNGIRYRSPGYQMISLAGGPGICSMIHPSNSTQSGS